MQKFIKDYHRNFVNLINHVLVTDKQGKSLHTHKTIEKISMVIKKQADIGGKLFFIGNGGSSAIASHMAIDFWKNGRIPAMAFNDGALLTCISNDFGYDYVFEKPIAFFANKNDVLFAISSSGKSTNILNGVRAAKSKGCKVITLSGFDPGNPLRSMGLYNFYVSSAEYGPVEVAHAYLCHFIFDTISIK